MFMHLHLKIFALVTIIDFLVLPMLQSVACTNVWLLRPANAQEFSKSQDLVSWSPKY